MWVPALSLHPNILPFLATGHLYPMHMLLTRIQVLGHWGFSDGFSQMPALELIYYMDSYFPILPSLLELLLLSCQFSHALEKYFYLFSFVLSKIFCAAFLSIFSRHLARNRYLGLMHKIDRDKAQILIDTVQSCGSLMLRC